MQQKSEDNIEVRTPLWSFQATGRTVLTVIGVIVILASEFIIYYVEAADHQKKADNDTIYQQTVIKRLEDITWVQMLPEEKKKQYFDQMEVPDSIRARMRK